MLPRQGFYLYFQGEIDMAVPIDLSKLTPAPWLHIKKRSWETIEPDVIDYTIDDDGIHGKGESDMPFIALARNAFDVLMRRGWAVCPRDGKWIVLIPPSVDALWKAFDLHCPDMSRDDPFTALVDADAWLTANMEKSP